MHASFYGAVCSVNEIDTVIANWFLMIERQHREAVQTPACWRREGVRFGRVKSEETSRQGIRLTRQSFSRASRRRTSRSRTSATIPIHLPLSNPTKLSSPTFC